MKVFVYGTLRRGFGNHDLLGTVESITVAAAPGLAMAIPRHAGFPYAIESTGSTITGELVSIAPGHASDALRRLDQLEGYHPARPARSHYLRTQRPVFTAGQLVDAWVCLAGPSVTTSQMPPLASGDWAHR